MLLNRQPIPADEAFEGKIFGQAEAVVDVGGVAIALFGPLPEFARVVGGRK